jgi:hypothetical protein
MTTWSRSRPRIVTQPAVLQSYHPVSTGDGGHTSWESATRILLQETRENKDKIACIDLRMVAGRLPPMGVAPGRRSIPPRSMVPLKPSTFVEQIRGHTTGHVRLIPASCLTWLKTAQMCVGSLLMCDSYLRTLTRHPPATPCARPSLRTLVLRTLGPMVDQVLLHDLLPEA